MGEIFNKRSILFSHETAECTASFAIPVLFLVFNRLELTKQVFASIAQIKPRYFYIASDGPRPQVSGECDAVEEIRAYILKNIDWDCEVKTLFRKKNLGCKIAVSEAISWFFDNEEMGIILEDDCLPNRSFFRFCEELLLKYRDDMRVWHIGGNNFGFTGTEKNLTANYCFIAYPQIWGWATWRSRWQFYSANNLNIELFNNSLKSIKQSTGLTTAELKIYYYKISGAFNGSIDTWDYQWHATVILNHGLCAVPFNNLISNLGDGEDATHTKNDKKRSRLGTEEFNFPLRHPKNFLCGAEMDIHFRRYLGLRRSILAKGRGYLSLFKRIVIRFFLNKK